MFKVFIATGNFKNNGAKFSKGDVVKGDLETITLLLDAKLIIEMPEAPKELIAEQEKMLDAKGEVSPVSSPDAPKKKPKKSKAKK